ncbi:MULTISPECIES: transposase [Bradyrhizobium]|uniref:transposase n=1 Tax=Bradyrhizobium TaxID=374 RepID=UPI0019D707CD
MYARHTARRQRLTSAWQRTSARLKGQIAAESLEPGAIAIDIARRHGCRTQQVHDWRRRARSTTGAAGFGRCNIVRAFGVGIVATGGCGASASIHFDTRRQWSSYVVRMVSTMSTLAANPNSCALRDVVDAEQILTAMRRLISQHRHLCRRGSWRSRCEHRCRRR